MKTGTLLCLALALATPSIAEEDWIAQSEGVVELSLAEYQRQGPCAGTLRLDVAHQVVLWKGVDESFGCHDPFEMAFADVESVEVLEDEPGLMLRLARKPKRMRLIPAPHFQWLMQEARVGGGISTHAAGSETVLSGPDGAPMRTGSTTPTVRKVEIPDDVAKDIQKAVELIREALEPGD